MGRNNRPSCSALHTARVEDGTTCASASFMKLKFLAFTCVVVFTGACADIEGEDAVTSLTTAAQQTLCEDFVATYCDHAARTSFCVNFSANPKCAEAVATNRVTSQCSDTTGTTVSRVTVQAVRDCAAATSEAAAMQACVGLGGGCMFDAVESN